MVSLGDAEQTRMIAEQVADAAITRFVAQHPEVKETQIPSPLKWAGGIVAALFTAGASGMAFWLVSSVSEMQVTLARVDERMANQLDQRERDSLDFDRLEGRVSKLEGYHSGASK